VGKLYQIVHEPMLVEWLARTYPAGTWRVNVRLGMPHPEILRVSVRPEVQRMVKITTPSADAVVTLPDEVHIIECLVRPEWWKILMLKVYGKLFPMTEEFRPHWEKPISLIVLAALYDPFMEWIAREEGVRVIYYRPPWLEPYYATQPPRRKTPPSVTIPRKRRRIK